MSKHKKGSVPVVMKKSGKELFCGIINGTDVMLHAAGKPWKSGTTVVHDCSKKNPKKQRKKGKDECRRYLRNE